MPLSRRQLLSSAALATATVASNIAQAPFSFASDETAKTEKKNAAPDQPNAFRHRSYLGWITDLASRGEPTTAWPSMRLDEELLADYAESFAAMKALGYNEIAIWGLYVTHAWPLKLADAVTPERGKLVERLIDLAHAQNIKVVSGLGIYSWGYEAIIRDNPALAPDKKHPLAMCGSDPNAWDWVQRVIDFAFTRFPIDGVSMQSADAGRCRCPKCSQHTPVEYDALVNIRAAEHIRSRWPGKIVGVSSWGMNFSDPAAAEPLVRLSKPLDYLIDVNNTSGIRGREARKQLISSLKCDFGTLGGPQVEPPQHWARDRWFLPTLKRTADHLSKLAADGGRACEYYYHIRANPGDAASMAMAGRLLTNPTGDWKSQAAEAVQSVYHLPTDTQQAEMLQIVLDAEEAYFKQLGPFCGTMSLEPLVGDKVGPPIYLKDRLTTTARREYAADLKQLSARVEKLRAGNKENKLLALTAKCLENVQGDLEKL
ncbi:MAG: hypothetical protein SGJ20_14035 [Planctomycetota bacterium]|nr:hypothetical protein [Planctomycetota bacterium]